MKKFTVVLFLVDNTLEAVPSKWIDKEKNTCKFPTVIERGFSKLRSDPNSTPLADWEPFQITTKFYSNSYLKAARKATELQFTSNVESESDSSVDGAYYERKKRKAKSNPRFQDFVSEKLPRLNKQQKPTKRIIQTDSDSEESPGSKTQVPLEKALMPVFSNSKGPELGAPEKAQVVKRATPAEARASSSTSCNSARSNIVLSEDEIPSLSPSRHGNGLRIQSQAINEIKHELRRFQEVILADLVIIKSELEVVRSAVVRNSPDSNIQCPFPIPIGSEIELIEAEGILEQEKDRFVIAFAFYFFSLFEMYVAYKATWKETWAKSIGGSTVDSNVRRILSRLFSHEFSLGFNFTGKYGKRSFQKLVICSTLIRSVVEKRRCTEDVVEKICSNWFRGGKDRNGGRSKRQKNTT